MRKINRKKAAWIATGILTFGIVFYVLFEALAIRSDLNETNLTIFTDHNGKSLYSENRLHSSKEVPVFISTYIKKEGKLQELPSMLYPANYAKQLISALLFKTMYSNNELMKIYINNAYLDYGIMDFSNGSNYYFQKKLSDTSKLEQIFLLSKEMRKRTNNVQTDSQTFLKQLYSKGYLTKKEYQTDEVYMYQLVDSLNYANTYAQSYIQQALLESEKALGINEIDLMRRSYTIQTNLDPDIQKTLYNRFENNDSFPQKENFRVESGMVVADKYSGKILALMGGRDYQYSSLNRASQITRQPASAFKPLAVFSPAIDMGWKPSNVLKDVPMVVGGYKPLNYDLTYRGQVTLKDTVIHSYNVPTVWLLYQLGLNNGINYLQKFGLFNINPNDGYKIGLGFLSKGTSPLAMAQAYTIFPNDGEMVELHTVQSIKDRSGELIYQPKIQKKRIIKKSTAREMNSLLQNVVKDGTGNKANLDGHFVAGKTGTTSYDGWFVGYTKNYITAVWMGSDEVNPSHQLTIDGGGYPSILFKKVMTDLNQ